MLFNCIENISIHHKRGEIMNMELVKLRNLKNGLTEENYKQTEQIGILQTERDTFREETKDLN
jgi:hypothetical protein